MANAAALLVAWQVIAVHRRFDAIDGGQQLCGKLGCQKFPQLHERAVLRKLALQ
jgi:hypothetical protein